MKLNLGAGQFRKEGYINIDNDSSTNPDVIWDLNKFPYPFSNSYFDLIEGDHVLEHLEEPFGVMKELHRILKLKGLLIIAVPHSSRGFTHPDHKRGFDVSFPLYFKKDFKGGYVGVSFTSENIKFTWFAQPYLKRKVLTKFQYSSGMALGAILSLMANLSPYLCSRLWCYWVGGFEEIKFELRKES